MNVKTLSVGSIAFDLIFNINPSFKQELPIINGKLEKVNMTFVGSEPEIIYGGTASNIAYSHALLNKNIILFSAVGTDFKTTMGKRLKDMGVDDRTVVFQSETARSHQITDPNGDQMIIWLPNAYSHIEETSLLQTISAEELKQCSWAIFSPGTPISTLKHMAEYKNNNPDGKIIFDPGQMINFYSKSQFEDALNMANGFIVNDVEIKKIETSFSILENTLIRDYFLDFIIITLGDKGCYIITKDDKKDIPLTSSVSVVETTGAGDAFRGGLLASIQNGYSIVQACKIANYVASKSVEHKGAQLHTLNDMNSILSLV